MIDYCLWQWLKEEPNVAEYVVTLTTSYVQVVPPDPMRFALIIPGGSSSQLLLKMGELNPGNPTWIIGSAFDANVIRWEDVGQFVQLAAFAKGGVGGSVVVFTSLAWNAQRFGVYRRMMDEHLSKYGAS